MRQIKYLPFTLFMAFVILYFFPIAPAQATRAKALIMDYKIATHLRSGGINETQAKITRLGKLVRYEPIPEGDEFHIFDYEKLIFYRVFTQEQIFFTYPIKEREISRAYQQGILSSNQPSPHQVQKIKLKETTLNNHPVTLYLVGKKPPGTHQSTNLHYSLVWESDNFKQMAIRIADTLGDGTTIIIDFSNMRYEEAHESLFQPPESYLHLSPF